MATKKTERAEDDQGPSGAERDRAPGGRTARCSAASVCVNRQPRGRACRTRRRCAAWSRRFRVHGGSGRGSRHEAARSVSRRRGARRPRSASAEALARAPERPPVAVTRGRGRAAASRAGSASRAARCRSSAGCRSAASRTSSGSRVRGGEPVPARRAGGRAVTPESLAEQRPGSSSGQAGQGPGRRRDR